MIEIGVESFLFLSAFVFVEKRSVVISVAAVILEVSIFLAFL